MKICKFCGSEFDGSSGLFCSKSCQGKYAVSFVKNHKCNFNLHKHFKIKIWKCPYCNKTISGKNQIIKHKKDEVKKFGYYLCSFCLQKFQNYNQLGNHTIHCKKNPNYEKIKKSIHNKLSIIAQKQKDNKELCKHFSKLAKQQNLGGYFYTKNGRRGLTSIVKAGMYKGIWCDSSWELAFIVYNIEHGIKFEKCNESFEYYSTYDNKKHKYHPDFKYDDLTYIEIKGWMNESSLIKINEFRKNHPNLKLEIIDRIQIKPYLDYVKEKYGKKFYEQLYD